MPSCIPEMVLPNTPLQESLHSKHLLPSYVQLVPGRSRVEPPASRGPAPRRAPDRGLEEAGRGRGVQGLSRRRTSPSAGLSPDGRDAGHRIIPATLARPSFAPSSSCPPPAPDVPIWSLWAGGHSPCHSRSRSGVSATAAPSAEPAGTASSSGSSGGSSDSSAIANHWARRTLRPALRWARRDRSLLRAPPLPQASPPLRPGDPLRHRHPCRHSVRTLGVMGWKAEKSRRFSPPYPLRLGAGGRRRGWTICPSQKFLPLGREEG